MEICGKPAELNKDCASVIAIDIGGGTQDILLWEDGKNIENCVKMILPSPTQIVAGKIRKATEAGVPIGLYGTTMGGGACSRAIKEHLKAGYRVYAEKKPALSIHDNLDVVESMGVKIVSDLPDEALKIYMSDVDTKALDIALSQFDVTLPDYFAVAVQDHGYSPHKSNREFRFTYWKDYLDRGGKLDDLWAADPPAFMTRMRAVKDTLGDALVVDTGAAAILGALCDEKVSSRQQEGLIILNLGNFHTVAALIKNDVVSGIYEHHTGLLTPEKLMDHLRRFREGIITNEEVFDDGGHGCAYSEAFSPRIFSDVGYVAVTGPRRSLVKELGFDFVAPYGDMMLTGSFGLLAAARKCWSLDGNPSHNHG